jgi:ubiquinone/menaquinone biosynthesis C-methylase UbiE
MTPEKTIIKAFTEMAPEYESKVDGELQRFWGWSYRAFIEHLIDVTPVKLGDKVLDVATGTGFIPRHLFLNGHSPKQVIALDITFEMLRNGKRLIRSRELESSVHLTCGSGMNLPYRSEYFDLVICGLASHHMRSSNLVPELIRVLKPGGTITIADVGSTPSWNNPIVKVLLRIGAFFYFLQVEGFSRALSEADSLSNILSAKSWQALLETNHLTNVQVEQLPTNHFWSPVPLILQASKPSI